MKIIIDNTQRITGDDIDFTIQLPISINDAKLIYNVYVQQVYIAGHPDNLSDYLKLSSVSLSSEKHYTNNFQHSNLICMISQTKPPFINEGEVLSGAKYFYQKQDTNPDFVISSLNNYIQFKVESLDGNTFDPYILENDQNHIIIVLFLQEI